MLPGLPGLVISKVETEGGDFRDLLSRVDIIEVGVASVGGPAAYAMVWEWGNVRQTKKGPKTVLGVNPDGSSVWLTIQAPRGWIAINQPLFWDAIDAEISKSELLDRDDPSATLEEAEKLSLAIGQRFKEILDVSVPIDSGALQESLTVIQQGDTLLDENDETVFDVAFNELELLEE